ncbi:MAG: cytochrome c oxidase subunit II [Acidobacteriota bacterium]|nr:cytochrome c oxidase subunit II [Acidobacteriota bacterium]
MGVFSIFPERASTTAGEVDALYAFLLVVAVGMTTLIFFLVFFFAIKYRRKSPDDPAPKPIHGSIPLEIVWSTIPLLVMLVMFAWGTKLYFQNYTPPANGTLDIYVTGKQWMWKVQHPTGQREINELHVPTGQPVKLILASEDVIHSFYIPAFRLKHDVVPGSYQTYWFEATKPGRYRILCAEYCGTNHSEMGGWVTVMGPSEYATWLNGGTAGSMADQGQQLFQQYGCVTCHVTDRQGRCPSLLNVYGKPVVLDDGRTIVADEAYIRESILNPNAKIVKGYSRDIMPVFEGQIGEDGVLQLIAYIKSLSTPPSPSATRSKK